MRPGMCGQAMGGHRVLPAWSTSVVCAGDVSGALELVDEAWDVATIYASMLDYIHLCARGQPQMESGVRVGGDVI